MLTCGVLGSRRLRAAVAALPVLAAMPASANALPIGPAMAFVPWQAQAVLQNPERPMCVGVQKSPAWGDRGNYTGPCRFGAPVAPMRAAVELMDRRQAVGTAQEYGLPGRFAARLEAELGVIARLPAAAGRSRLLRHARSETRAARDPGDSKRPSWPKRAAVNCALWGAIAGEGTLLYEVYFHDGPAPREIASRAALGCAMAVVTPTLNRWIKSKGYDLADD